MRLFDSAAATLPGIFALSIATSAGAQDFSHCESVYQNAVRNVLITETSYSSLNTVFDNYCTSSGERKSSDTNVGLDAVVNSIPINLTGSQSTAEEKMSSFCRSYSNVRYTSNAASEYRNDVVVAALSAFNQCIAITRNKIFIDASTANGLTGSYSFRFGSDVNYELQGIVTEGYIKCSSALGGNEVKELTEETHAAIKKNFSINCVREAVDREGGSRYYPRTSVIVSSNQGPYSAIFPAEEVADFEFTSLMAGRMATMEERLAALAGETASSLSALSARAGSSEEAISRLRAGMVARSYYVGRGTFGERIGSGATFIGCRAIDDWATEVCGGLNKHINQISHVGGHQCGYTYATVTCYGFQ